MGRETGSTLRCFAGGAWIGALCALFCFCPGVVFAQAGAGGAFEMDRLLAQCAPNVHPETMRGLVGAESKGHMFAIADAGPKHLPWSVRKTMVRSFYPGSLAEAVRVVGDLQAAGHTVSIGPAQINDRNLRRMGVSVADAFEPCRNVAIGGQILGECYGRASKKFGQGGQALHAALSCYNSGDFERGARDGYVGLVYAQAGKPLVLKVGGGKAGVTVPVPSLASAGAVPWVERSVMDKPKGLTRSGRKVAGPENTVQFGMSVKPFSGKVSNNVYAAKEGL